jgi:hypothetical protein
MDIWSRAPHQGQIPALLWCERTQLNMQAKTSGDARLTTDVAGIRYRGVTAAARLGGPASAAAQPPALVLPAAGRFLRELEPRAGSRAKSLQLWQGVPIMPTTELNSHLGGFRRLMQAQDAGSFVWLDLQGDGIANSVDSDAYMQVIQGWNQAGSAQHLQQYCNWLNSLYNPSRSTSLVLDETFTDTSIVSTSSNSWQAIDPKLIALRTTKSKFFRPQTSCSGTALVSAQQLPVLPRFDGTVPPSQSEFFYLTGQQRTQAYDDLMHPNLDAFRTYQVSAIDNQSSMCCRLHATALAACDMTSCARGTELCCMCSWLGSAPKKICYVLCGRRATPGD